MASHLASPEFATRNCSHLSFVDDLYGRTFLHGLLQLRNRREYIDVVLKVGDTAIPCHRVVLAASSPYFHAMFSSGLEEASAMEVEIKGTDGPTLEAILTYAYSSEIEITTSNVQNLIAACEQFRFEGLKLACERFMLQQVEPDNAIGLYKFAKLYGLTLLQEGARDVMLTRFKDVVRGGEFCTLLLEELLEYIDDNLLEVPNEDVVAEAAILWVQHDEDSRKEALDRVMSIVRLPFCSANYLCQIRDRSGILNSQLCHEFLEEARRYQMLPEHRHEISSIRTVPRCSFRVNHRLVVVGGLTREDRENRYCWYLHEETGSWELLAQMPKPNWKFYSVCVTVSGILISGGYHGNVKSECWMFDTSEKKWKALPSMREARCKHRTVMHGDGVFVLGGEDDFDQPLCSMEHFHLQTRQWTCLPPMLKSLSDPLAVSYGRYIYVLGGIEENDGTSMLTQVYDTVWGDWSLKSEMPQPCRLGAVATLNDKLYVVGGYTRSCMSYDPPLDMWCELTPPREKHGNAPAIVWKGRILVGGGDVDSNATTSVIEEYDPINDKWSYWAVPLKEELSCHYLINVDLLGI